MSKIPKKVELQDDDALALGEELKRRIESIGDIGRDATFTAFGEIMAEMMPKIKAAERRAKR